VGGRLETRGVQQRKELDARGTAATERQEGESMRDESSWEGGGFGGER